MTKVLLDTSVIIDYLRKPNRENSIFTQVRGVFDMVLSFITLVELYSGRSSKEEKTSELIEEIIASCEIRLVSPEIARKAGSLRRDFQLSLGDSFVAQLAQSEELQLVTLDKKCFKRVPGIIFYSVEGKRKGS